MQNFITDNVQEPNTSSVSSTVHRWKWWFMVAINIALLLIGQSGAVILGKFYFDQGGNSVWMATLVQSVAFPVLFLPFFFFPEPKNLPIQSSVKTLAIFYFFLGILLAGDNLLYSYGLLYLPVSTYSLICASQLAFNAIFSFFINSQKITLLILNSVILLTVSASLVAINSVDKTRKVSNNREFIMGFVCTIASSAGYALWLSLMQLTIEKVLKKETFTVVLEMQIWTCLVASIVCLVGLFASGEVKGLREEIEKFEGEKWIYVLTLVGTALCWQVCSVGVVGLIYIVSSLFSNVVSMMNLPLVPVTAVVLYHETMDGVKVLALFLAILSFGSYIYQNYLDQKKHKNRTHFAKIEFPKFSGGDPRGWILEGDALDLFAWVNTERTLLYCDELTKILNEHYGPPEFLNPDEFLCAIKQTGTVAEYRKEWTRRVSRVTNWPEHCLLGLFVNGLKEELRSEVRLHKSRLVYCASSLAVELEKASRFSRPNRTGFTVGQNRSTFTGQNGAPNRSMQPTNLNLAELSSSNLSSANLSRPNAWETTRQQRRDKGLCFRCGELFRPGHKCQTSSLALLEVDEGEGGDG